MTKLPVRSILVLALLASAAVHCMQGPMEISPGQAAAIVLDRLGIPGLKDFFSSAQSAILWEVRLPRTVLAILVGAALATSGATLQGLFRNPLADPGLIGISSGSTMGAVLGMVLLAPLLAGFPQLAIGFTPLMAMLGGWAATAVAYHVARIGKRTHVSTLLLAGVAINAFAGAFVGVALYVASDDQLRRLTFWMLGSLHRAEWRIIWIVLPLIAFPVYLIRHYRAALNAFMLGEAQAFQLGVPVQRMKRILIALNALMVGAAVSFCGLIGFVGLVTPHIVRLWIGPDHRRLLPACVLLGPIIMLLADTLARTINAPGEVPIGILTALLGAPFFLYLILLRKQGLDG